MNDGPYSLEPTSRQIIEQKLLTALQDENTVALLVSKDDLDVIIGALEKYRHSKVPEFVASLKQLKKAAFP